MAGYFERMNSYQRIFGAGPIGFFASAASFAAAHGLRPWLGAEPLLPLAWPVRVALFALACALAGTLASWSLWALPVAARGRSICAVGPFRWVRHPLYAALLWPLALGLVVLSNHWVYALWAVLLHPLWHGVVGREEALMEAQFGADYVAYCRRTGRFAPKLRAWTSNSSKQP